MRGLLCGHAAIMREVTIFFFLLLLIHSRVVPELTKHHGTNLLYL
jgi:hypothetical protein